MAAVLESPGFWHFLGGLNPLETIRRYLEDRHQRKHSDVMLPYDQRQRELELMLLENQVIRDHIEILRGLGLSDEELRAELLARPRRALRQLDPFVNGGMITGAPAIEPAG